MRKALLLYNPLSGPRERLRLAKVTAAAAVLRGAGIEVEVAATRAPGSAAGQVGEALRGGCDTVFACGGDGTIHEVLQGVVGTGLTLGIIPMGTANALAHDLGMPLSPEKAARAALTADARRFAVGKVEYLNFDQARASRYFTVTAGVGADAHLFYSLNVAVKNRLGVSAYYLMALGLWLTRRMAKFAVAVGADEQQEVSQVLAVRIANFGGVLKNLAPGAGLERDVLRVVLFHRSKRRDYLRYIVRGFLGTSWQCGGVELRDAAGLSCGYLEGGERIFVEADGELLGTLPVELSVVPDAVTLLVPRHG